MLAVACGGELQAQGVTTAAVVGTVRTMEGGAVEGAEVLLTSAADGGRWSLRPGADGRFDLELLPVGGPYLLVVSAVGYQPVRFAPFRLALGERHAVTVALRELQVVLEPVTISAAAEAARSGPSATLVSDSEIARLPNVERDFTSLAVLSPLVDERAGRGLVLGSQSFFATAVTVDGGVAQDLYLGRSPGGESPGGGSVREVLPRGIALEAVREFQVLAAPFDVRYGDFTGGMLNAVTRTGTAVPHGSLFTRVENGAITGSGPGGGAPDFTTWQAGGAVGFPLLGNRLQVFASAGVERQVVPDAGPFITDTSGGADLARFGISASSAQRFDSILTARYGLPAGGLLGVPSRNPSQDQFVKVTGALAGGRLEVSVHSASGTHTELVPTTRASGTYALTSAAQTDRSTLDAYRAAWSGLVAGRWWPELSVGWQHLTDACTPFSAFGRVQVAADNGTLVAGPDLVCPTDRVAQVALSLGANVSVAAGTHLVTMGTQVERLGFRDSLFDRTEGVWTFYDLDSLLAGRPRQYQRGLPGPAYQGGPLADFTVRERAAYLQDRWAPLPRLAVTVGVRIDAASADAGTTNQALLRDTLHLDTGRLPGGALWSPRLGVDLQLGRDGTTALHGGIGLFTGRPPYFWIANGYRDNGEEQLLLMCSGPRAPDFDPAAPPAVCRDSTGPKPRVSAFAPGVRDPQTLKADVSWSRRRAVGLSLDLDLLASYGLHQLYLTDANLRGPVSYESGEGGRPLYGTLNATTGLATPRYTDTAYGQVILIRPSSGDRALTASITVRWRFASGAELGAGYARGRALDYESVTNFNARANLAGTPLDGTLDRRNLRTSFFEARDRLTLIAAAPLPAGIQLALLYSGGSGSPFTYTVNGDANADGIGGAGFVLQTDPIYVPKSSVSGSDIELVDASGANAPASDYARLERLVQTNRCLRRQRGSVMARNTCFNPWEGRLDARLVRPLRLGGSTVELGLDVFNVLSLIRPAWGEQRVVTLDPAVPLLQLVRYDPGAQRGVYRLAPTPSLVDDFASRWRLQLGVTLSF